MADLFGPAGAPADAAAVGSWSAAAGTGWLAGPAGSEFERGRLIADARDSDAARQLLRCFPRWRGALEALSWRALARLARGEPVDPNDPEAWRSRDEHAEAVLRRHGVSRLRTARLTLGAIGALVEGQARADREAGLDWSTVTAPADRLDERLRRAHARLRLDLSDPAIYAHRTDQRRALGRRVGLAGERAGELSRWALSNPDGFDPAELRSWRIGSGVWLALADEQLPPVGRVERPVGLFVVPAVAGQGWQLVPVLSLEAMRLVVSLGGRLGRELGSAVLPWRAVGELLERINVRALHAGPRECLDSAGQLAQELSRQLGRTVSPGAPRDRRDRWGRLLISRNSYKSAGGRSASCGCGSSPSAAASSAAAASVPPRSTARSWSRARRWNSARRSTPPSREACRCCCRARPPASSRTRPAWGG